VIAAITKPANKALISDSYEGTEQRCAGLLPPQYHPQHHSRSRRLLDRLMWARMTWAQRSVSQCAELFSLRRHWHVRLGDVLLQLPQGGADDVGLVLEVGSRALEVGHSFLELRRRSYQVTILLPELFRAHPVGKPSHVVQITQAAIRSPGAGRIYYICTWLRGPSLKIFVRIRKIGTYHHQR
jgi:hypothetical protein